MAARRSDLDIIKRVTERFTKTGEKDPDLKPEDEREIDPDDGKPIGPKPPTPRVPPDPVEKQKRR